VQPPIALWCGLAAGDAGRISAKAHEINSHGARDGPELNTIAVLD
jgi:hypothetical protein